MRRLFWLSVLPAPEDDDGTVDRFIVEFDVPPPDNIDTIQQVLRSRFGDGFISFELYATFFQKLHGGPPPGAVAARVFVVAHDAFAPLPKPAQPLATAQVVPHPMAAPPAVVGWTQDEKTAPVLAPDEEKKAPATPPQTGFQLAGNTKRAARRRRRRHHRAKHSKVKCPRGIRCADAAECPSRHSPEEIRLFNDPELANCRFELWKTRLCTKKAHHRAATCRYAHDARELFCTICHNAGHSFVECTK